MFSTWILGLSLLSTLQAYPAGNEESPFISGGVDAPEGAYNYAAEIGGCTASILTENTILTAAHCCMHEVGDYTVHVGSHKLSSGGAKHKLKAIIRHENYPGATVFSDICILKLAEPIQLGPNTAKVGFPKKYFVVPTGGFVTLMGWGAWNKPGSPDNLQVVYNFTAAAPKECGTGDFCTIPPQQGQSTCPGDSGGPYIYKGMQVGVHSRGYGCGLFKPTIATNVLYFLDWIHSVLGEDAANLNLIDPSGLVKLSGNVILDERTDSIYAYSRGYYGGHIISVNQVLPEVGHFNAPLPPSNPKWADASAQIIDPHPEIFILSDNDIRLYFTALDKATGYTAIGVASSDKIINGYSYRVLETPLLSVKGYNLSAPAVIRTNSGGLLLLYANRTEENNVDHDWNQVYAVPLSADGLKVEEGTPTMGERPPMPNPGLRKLSGNVILDEATNAVYAYSRGYYGGHIVSVNQVLPTVGRWSAPIPFRKPEWADIWVHKTDSQPEIFVFPNNEIRLYFTALDKVTGFTAIGVASGTTITDIYSYSVLETPLLAAQGCHISAPSVIRTNSGGLLLLYANKTEFDNAEEWAWNKVHSVPLSEDGLSLAGSPTLFSN